MLGATPLWKSPAYTVAFRRAEESRLSPIIERAIASVHSTLMLAARITLPQAPSAHPAPVERIADG
jgi:hypothetical protein